MPPTATIEAPPIEKAVLPPQEVLPIVVPEIIPNPNAITDPTVLMHERLLKESSSQLVDASVELDNGTRKETEELHARASLAEFGLHLEGYIASRLADLERNGGKNLDVGLVVQEVDTLVKQIYIATLEGAGISSKAEGLIAKLRIGRAGKYAGMVLGAAAGFGVSKGVGMGIDEASQSINSIISVAGTVTSGFVGNVLQKETEKFAKSTVGDKVEETLNPFEDDVIETVEAMEEKMETRFTNEEKIALARWVKAGNDTLSLWNDMLAIVGGRYTSTEESEVANPQEIAHGLTDMVVKHIADLLDIKHSEKPRPGWSYLGKLGPKTMGLVIKNITGSAEAGEAAETGAERVADEITH